MKKFIPLFAFAFGLHLAYADSVTSNTHTVKAWIRDSVHFDTETGAFNRPEIPTLAEADALFLVAANITNLYDEATEAMETNLAPLRARLEVERARPIVSLALSVSQDNALDRRNFTLCVVSNEITLVSTNWHVRGWVFSNNVLKSEPIMDAEVRTTMGETVATYECAWKEYGTNAVEVVIDGETYETYEMSVDVPTNLVRNINMLVERWVSVGTRDKGFNYGNRQCRINGVMCTTTNDCSFLGRFMTTNGVDLTELFTPYIDRGDFRFAEKQEEESEE